MFSSSKKAKSTTAIPEVKKEEKQDSRSNTPVRGLTKSVTISEPVKGESKLTIDTKRASAETKSSSNDRPLSSSEGGRPLSYSREAIKALAGGLMDAVLDIRVSTTEQQEADLSRNGYLQLLQEDAKKASSAATSTFGNRSSLWIWRRNQGTCSGRLKPIIDIILDSASISSELVLAGYTCDPITISGQSLWIKRATTEEEEKDAIIDLFVKAGKMKDPSDKMWESPGVGWIRVDGNFSKSSGFFSSVDSFVWYRPARTRSYEQSLINPIKGAVALSEESRQAKLIAAVRIALRHYVPIKDIKRLANLIMENNQLILSPVVTETIRSERIMDFSNLFHQYSTTKDGKLYLNKWNKMLYDIGIRMKTNDINQVFNFFDANLNTFITIEEFTAVLALTDYELDLALDKIRLKLLIPCIPKDILKIIPISSKGGSGGAGIGHNPAISASSRNDTTAVGNLKKSSQTGVIGGLNVTHPYLGKHKIRESLALINIFNMINIKNDSILSLDEMMDLASKVEVFISEEEARKLLSMMDIDGDDRVELHDFVGFMKKESYALIKKAFRLRETSAVLRRWLVRGTSEKIQNTNSATASKTQWKWFKIRYEKAFLSKFPGFLSPPILQSTLNSLGIRLSAIEARELTLIVAPEKAGRIHLADLHAFMGRSCRSLGELIALIERDLFPDLIDTYRAHYHALKVSGKEDHDLATMYRRKLDEIKKFIENIYTYLGNKKEKGDKASAAGGGGASSNKDSALTTSQNQPGDRASLRSLRDEDDDDDDEPPPTATMAIQPAVSQDLNRFLKGSHEVISVNHLKTGIQEWVVAKNIPENVFPNLEEWTCLATLVDADVTEGKDLFFPSSVTDISLSFSLSLLLLLLI
jgi:Ca2+-binding EF-hand superfamily protein